MRNKEMAFSFEIKEVLGALSKPSPQVNYKFNRLYRILFNEEMYYVAYQRINAKEVI